MTDKKMRGGGFSAMTPERLREVAKAGGRALHAQGKAHTFTDAERAAGGRKGGKSHAEVEGYFSRLGKIPRRKKRTKAKKQKTLPAQSIAVANGVRIVTHRLI